MAISVNKLNNCNVYVNGNSLLGRVEEFDVPELVYKMAEHKALGMFGSFEVPTGLDKMEARLKWSSIYQDILGSVSKPFTAVQLQIRGNIQNFGSAGVNSNTRAVVTMTAMPKKLPGQKYKQHDNVELETTFSVTRVKCEVGNQVLYEIDVMANIFNIDGEDQLVDFRNNQ